MSAADVDHDLLRVIADLAEQDRGGTADISKAKYDADGAAGRNRVWYNRPPFFGLDREFRALEDAGYIEIDPGMAEMVPPGQPTPTVGEFYIDLTAAGRDALRDS